MGLGDSSDSGDWPQPSQKTPTHKTHGTPNGTPPAPVRSAGARSACRGPAAGRENPKETLRGTLQGFGGGALVVLVILVAALGVLGGSAVWSSRQAKRAAQHSTAAVAELARDVAGVVEATVRQSHEMADLKGDVSALLAEMRKGQAKNQEPVVSLRLAFVVMLSSSDIFSRKKLLNTLICGVA